MESYEQLGVLYLGRRHDPERGPLDEPLLYDARDLTTHALIVGMTGSGKTGLAVGLLEELAIDGIPAIAIDPKGDLGNLALNFPGLSGAEFRPWIDEEDAARAGRTSEAHAAAVAQQWAEGLSGSHQDAARMARLRDAAEVTIYTPGSSAGIPLSILRSLSAPPAALADDDELWRERVASTASSLLALLGLESDPRTGREHILLARLVADAWKQGRDLDLASLIRAIQQPPFESVGVVDVETFFPAKERTALALQLNNLLAGTGFEAWMAGEPLDVQRLLWTPEGRPRIAILSIAHLPDAERMFFVTLLLEEVIAWMRAQPGTSSLRAALYMDEVFGYFPPVANPPAKAPMLTLLKQARAYGLGIVLATQNPVDLDYKGLGNCGSWFLGRLQTERDRLRVLDGLEGASTTAGRGFDRARTEALLAGLPKRTFLLNDVHESEPVLFQTRWTMSYLRGPLTRPQIKALMESQRQRAVSAVRTPAAPRAPAPSAPAAPVGAPPVASKAATTTATTTATPPAAATAPATASGARPLLPPEVREVFLGGPSVSSYVARLMCEARLHYVDSRCGVDTWMAVTLLAPVEADGSLSPWEQAREVDPRASARSEQPASGATLGELPSAARRAKSWPAFGKSAADHLYRNRPLRLLRAPDFKLVSRPGEPEGDFRARVAHAAREARDAELGKLQKRWAPRLRTLTERERRVQEKLRVQQAQYDQSKLSTAVSIGGTLLGALFGRKLGGVGNARRAGSAVRGVSRSGREKDDVAAAQAELADVQAQLAQLTRQLEAEAEQLRAGAVREHEIVEVAIAPRKADIAIESLVLAWVGEPPATPGA